MLWALCFFFIFFFFSYFCYDIPPLSTKGHLGSRGNRNTADS